MAKRDGSTGPCGDDHCGDTGFWSRGVSCGFWSLHELADEDSVSFFDAGANSGGA